MKDLGKLLIIAGLVIAALGVALTVGRLPGDIVYRRGNFTFFFPIVTSIVLSIVLTLVLWLFRR